MRHASRFWVPSPLAPWGHDHLPSTCCINPGMEPACGIQVACPCTLDEFVDELGLGVLALSPQRGSG
jgi:hypothetical protein